MRSISIVKVKDLPSEVMYSMARPSFASIKLLRLFRHGTSHKSARRLRKMKQTLTQISHTFRSHCLQSFHPHTTQHFVSTTIPACLHQPTHWQSNILQLASYLLCDGIEGRALRYIEVPRLFWLVGRVKACSCSHQPHQHQRANRPPRHGWCLFVERRTVTEVRKSLFDVTTGLSKRYQTLHVIRILALFRMEK